MTQRRAEAVAVMALAWGIAWSAMGAVLGLRALLLDVAPISVLAANAVQFGTYGMVVGLWFGLIVAALARIWTKQLLFVPVCVALVASVAYAMGVGAEQSPGAAILLALFGAACGVVSLGLAARQPNQGVAAGVARGSIPVASSMSLVSAALVMFARRPLRSRTPTR